EEQDYLQTAATESVPFMRSLWDARVEVSKQRVLERGVAVVENVDHAAFAEKMLPVWGRFVTTPAMQATVDEIVSLGAQFGGANE
ncbi:MAG: TRAP transporter substrate-binding protein, partial [Pseudomonadota bacterium]